jgi:hypothetical protein
MNLNYQHPMKTTRFIAAAALAAMGLGAVAFAQTSVQAAPPAPQAAPTAVAPAPNEVIYLPQLPAASALAASANGSQGVTIDKIDQTSAEITVVYRFANGQTNTVAYRLIGQADATAAPTAAPAYGVPAPTTPAPAVVYAPGYVAAPGPYYYDYGPYAYAPYGYYWTGWFAPVGIGIGLGFGFHGGGFHGGGFHGHR